MKILVEKREKKIISLKLFENVKFKKLSIDNDENDENPIILGGEIAKLYCMYQMFFFETFQ